MTTLFMSCSSSDDSSNSNNNAAQIQAVENAAESGTWRVASYIDEGVDETNDFNGYDFTFSANGTVMASNGTNTYNGTWSVTNSSNSNDDSSDDDIDFNLMFQVAADHDFDDLNDDWDIVSHSASTISLIDVSGGNGGTDTLVFQKN
ncbi:MAG: hypothetical protein KJO41_02540 [Bacteroidia bacterium]|nr:hypothetical protein [Bacteroidia bacterium]NND25886.1 hypothetical protein [Flavobacteriaceae bacterium]MBT8277853.1 hypothetical protein [Bacteroidia bacterium]NNK59064.1 hypothetical protein [Flavobacteriaceae bacterium]NNL32509.1 hypothetical protein [Flavobacteriaceae bacterium]